MVLAFFIECSCPPHLRGATVGGGGLKSVEEFLGNYQLTHIECGRCGTYNRLIGYMDGDGVEHLIDSVAPAPRHAGRAMFPRLRRAIA